LDLWRPRTNLSVVSVTVTGRITSVESRRKVGSRKLFAGVLRESKVCDHRRGQRNKDLKRR
jgi:hypothetical protein